MDMNEKCIWVYRPGVNGSMWAVAKCDHIFRPLTRVGLKVKDNEKIGCADWYNNRSCPGCGKPIQIDYDLIKRGVKAV